MAANAAGRRPPQGLIFRQHEPDGSETPKLDRRANPSSTCCGPASAVLAGGRRLNPVAFARPRSRCGKLFADSIKLRSNAGPHESLEKEGALCPLRPQGDVSGYAELALRPSHNLHHLLQAQETPDGRVANASLPEQPIWLAPPGTRSSGGLSLCQDLLTQPADLFEQEVKILNPAAVVGYRAAERHAPVDQGAGWNSGA